jgi:hypothetical protein
MVAIAVLHDFDYYDWFCLCLIGGGVSWFYKPR